jgi:DNA polymerase III epsilon subunit-like protein
VQLAWVVCESDGRRAGQGNYLIRPEGFSIPRDATAVHGITTTKAKQSGAPLEEALTEFAGEVEKADTLVAHNLNFDLMVIGAELVRCTMSDIFNGKAGICTMREATNYCRIPKRGRGYKWPTLEELHGILFGEDIEGAHDAAADVEACLKSYYRLRELEVVE